MSPAPATPPGRRLVRPYAVTGGRTSGAWDHASLPLESLCQVTVAGRSAGLAFERAAIAVLCARLQSIAEVAALTGLPLGVARVLVGDMRAEGLLEVHLPARVDSGRASVALLEKVLDGLRSV